MKPTIIQVQNEPYLVYERAGCPWKVFVQQDGNEDQYVADFCLDWEGTAIFTLLPSAESGGLFGHGEVILEGRAIIRIDAFFYFSSSEHPVGFRDGPLAMHPLRFNETLPGTFGRK